MYHEKIRKNSRIFVLREYSTAFRDPEDGRICYHSLGGLRCLGNSWQEAEVQIGEDRSPRNIVKYAKAEKVAVKQYERWLRENSISSGIKETHNANGTD